MEQSPTVRLDYKPASSLRGAHWVGDVLGREMKFARVVAGIAFPKLDREASALIVLGEVDRSSAPVNLYGLGAATGSVPEIKNPLTQFCHDLRPETIVVENKPSEKIVWSVTDGLIGLKPLPLSAVAPEHSLTETGRQGVDSLLGHDQLHIDHLLSVLDSEKDQADRALRLVVNWMLDFTAFYPGKKRQQPKYGRLLGEF